MIFLAANQGGAPVECFLLVRGSLDRSTQTLFVFVVVGVVVCWGIGSAASSAARDTRAYRQGYPGQSDRVELTSNVRFYRNELVSTPRGGLIDHLHRAWRGDFDLLERHHGFIQWLFPIREQSAFNGDADPLQLHEAESIRSDPACQARVVRSFEMMLEFYGFRLVDAATGAVERSPDYRDRFANLAMSGHNWLRVSRILKSLGELGFEHYKLPWLLALVHEVFVTKELAACRQSLLNYWAWTLRNPADLARLRDEIAVHVPAAKDYVLEL